MPDPIFGVLAKERVMGGLAVIFLIGLYFVLTVVAIVKAKPVWVKGLVLLAALLIPIADAVYGRIKLQQMCKAEGGLKVYRVAEHVEGFMGNSNEKWIKEYGFQFVEEDKYGRSGSYIKPRYTRFSMQNGQVVREDDSNRKSKFRLRDEHTGEKDRYGRVVDFIEEIPTGEVLATYTSIHFHGGWAERLIAMSAAVSYPTVASCPKGDAYRDRRTLIISTLKP